MNENKAKFLRVLLISFFGVFLFLFFLWPAQKVLISEEAKETSMILKNNSNNELQIVEAKVNGSLLAIQLANNKSSEKIVSKFSNAMVLGDSISEGLLDYRILNEETCIGVRGRRANNMEADFMAIISRQPKHLFLEYGMNDLGYCRGDAQYFIAYYKETIDMIKNALPDTKIYVNGILPIEQKAIDNNPVYAAYPAFNEAMIEMCKEKDIIFMDNSILLEHLDVKYEFDGVHPKPDYYELWAAHMAQVAGL